MVLQATGVYSIPLYDMLTGHGIRVVLVNAQHTKNVPGRKSDVIICGGFNIYPREVEEFLQEQEEIAEAAVAGVQQATAQRDSAQSAVQAADAEV